MIIRLTDTPIGLMRQCNYNAHETWKALIEKYEVSNDKQESRNESTNIWNSFRIKDTIQDSHIWLNEAYNLNLNFKKIKEKYEKDKGEMMSPVFDVLPDEYKPVRVSYNVNISKMACKDLKEEIICLCKAELG